MAGGRTRRQGPHWRWGPPHVTLLVVDLKPLAGIPRPRPPVAVRPRQKAFVFYNRILDVTRRRAVDEEDPGGRVMAHEIGHLLLPPGKHNHYGIMQRDIDVDATHRTASPATKRIGSGSPDAAEHSQQRCRPYSAGRRHQPRIDRDRASDWGIGCHERNQRQDGNDRPIRRRIEGETRNSRFAETRPSTAPPAIPMRPPMTTRVSVCRTIIRRSSDRRRDLDPDPGGRATSPTGATTTR